MDKFKSGVNAEDLLLNLYNENIVLQANMALCKALFVEIFQKKGMNLGEINMMFLKRQLPEIIRLVSENEYFTDEYKAELKNGFVNAMEVKKKPKLVSYTFTPPGRSAFLRWPG